MAKDKTPLPVERLTEAQLWATLHGRLCDIQSAAAASRGRTGIWNAAHDASDCAQELRRRGIQLTMDLGLAAF